MNRARVASLLRELADELERDGTEEDRPSRPRPKPKRRAPTLVAPPGEADDLTKAKAARFLRQNGWRTA